jgi:hypothetical protein
MHVALLLLLLLLHLPQQHLLLSRPRECRRNCARF